MTTASHETGAQSALVYLESAPCDLCSCAGKSAFLILADHDKRLPLEDTVVAGSRYTLPDGVKQMVICPHCLVALLTAATTTLTLLFGYDNEISRLIGGLSSDSHDEGLSV